MSDDDIRRLASRPHIRSYFLDHIGIDEETYAALGSSCVLCLATGKRVPARKVINGYARCKDHLRDA